MTIALILIAVLCLAYANDANDNFKGVALLFGSGTADYRRALVWATITTLLGSLTAAFLAEELLQSFSGKGLVDESLVSNPNYGSAVALAAGLTDLSATRLGMPISTTHSLVGALVGAGWASGSAINLDRLGSEFSLPFIVSPLVAMVGNGTHLSLVSDRSSPSECVGTNLFLYWERSCGSRSANESNGRAPASQENDG